MRALLATVLLGFVAPLPAATHKADIVVYGGTASGLIAALAAARQGKTVVVVNPDKHLGGMVTGGLGATDVGNAAAIGGYSREFFDRVKAFYVKKYGAKSAQVKACNNGFRIEPSVAMSVMMDLLKENKIEPYLDHRLTKVQKKGATLTAIETSKKDTFAGKVFIDATYEGDLMAMAGVKYVVGREGVDEFKESIAGVQKYSPAHQWLVKVNGYDAKKKLLPFIQSGSPGKPGAGDKKVQAYNFRLCLTKVKTNMVPFPRPPGYEVLRYELLARYLKARHTVKVGQLMNPVPVPNGKTDTNNNGPFSTDHIGANWDYPDADHAKRRKMWLDHKHYTQGFLYFLANDDRVPKALQTEMRSWGLAKDEFTDTGYWPPQLYVREARRMRGVYLVTQADIMTNRTKDDSVGLGAYNTDSHHVQRVVKEDGNVINEGDFQVPVAPYAIPYRSLTPKAAECDNLLVPVCLSATHVAYGTIRMEPVYMILGQASGVAAALAVEGKTTVQKVSTEKLTSLLKKQKAVLSPVGLPGRQGTVRRIDAAKLQGVVVDDVDAKLTGEWKRSQAVGPFVGTGYLHDDNANKGKMKARFVPKLPAAGMYQVRLFYAASSNRATNALVVIKHKDGEKQVRVDQCKTFNGNDGVLLGTFAFEAGTAGWAEVRNDGTKGHVIADAVQFLPVKKRDQ